MIWQNDKQPITEKYFETININNLKLFEVIKDNLIKLEKVIQ